MKDNARMNTNSQPPETERRAFRTVLQLVIGFWVAFLIASPLRAASPDQTGTAAQSMTAAEIVHQLDLHNQQRTARLKSYRSVRNYHLEYAGFPHRLEASMTVEAIYEAPGTRTFRVLSQSGSKLLVDRALKRLLTAEAEASRHPRETAITPANYNFTLLRSESENGHKEYVLHVDPKVSKQFLYRGEIWVDASDYAVQQIQAEPAHSPSFWIRNTAIHHVYFEKEGFWLPKEDQSTTRMRFGGQATLTIQYGDYQLQTSDGQNSSGAAQPHPSNPSIVR